MKRNCPLMQDLCAASGFAVFRQKLPQLVLFEEKFPDSNEPLCLRHLKRFGPGEVLPLDRLTVDATGDAAGEKMGTGPFDGQARLFEMEDLTMRARRAPVSRRGVRPRVRDQNPGIRDHNILGGSPAMRAVVDLVGRVSQSCASTVLIRGESGTGKDLVAKAIHFESSRASKPFMNITCTALQDSLLESELFGHEKGAFTDAKTQKKGLFELANGGTVFLDEIGDMSPSLQAKLLRVLEEKAFRRVGGNQDIRVDVRVIAATNRDLEKAIADGRFREDLYYRLNIITIDVPALRDHREDIPELARHFLTRFSVESKRDIAEISAEALDRLKRHNWPGNVRELRNVLERAELLGKGAVIEACDIALGRSTIPLVTDGHLYKLPPEPISFEELERDFVLQALERSGGNQTRAGLFLGMTRDQMRYRMVKYGLLHGSSHPQQA